MEVNCANIVEELLAGKLNDEFPFETRTRKYAVDAVRENREKALGERKEEIKKLGEGVEALAEETQQENDKILEGLDEKVRKVWTEAYGKKNLALCLRLMKEAKMTEQEIKTFKEYIVEGTPLTGDIPRCRFFKEPSGKDAERFERKHEKNRRNCKPLGKPPSGPAPKWAGGAANEASWKAFKSKVIGKGMAHLVVWNSTRK